MIFRQRSMHLWLFRDYTNPNGVQKGVKMKVELKAPVQLSEEYYIEQDTYCYALKKSYVSYGNGKNKSAKPRLIEKVVGYYPKFVDCIERFVKETIKDNTKDFSGDLESYCSRIEDITNNAVGKIMGYWNVRS